jgi:hypothetical protein
MELIIFAIVIVFVYLCGAVHGWNLRERYAKRMLGMIAQQFEEQVQQQTENLKHIIIEKHKDTFFVYEKESNTFMAQGNSRDELEEVLKKRFPDTRFACSEKILHDVGFL